VVPHYNSKPIKDIRVKMKPATSEKSSEGGVTTRSKAKKQTEENPSKII
jgi:hypothetical protein